MKLNFSMLKHKTFSIHEIFLAPLVVSKAIFFWSLSNILQCPSSHASQLPLIRKIWKTQNILDFNARNDFYVFLGVLQHHIISNASILNVLVPLFVRKRNFHVQLSTRGVLNIFFLHPYYLLVVLILSFLVSILILLLFPIFLYSWCCLFECVFVVDKV